MKINTYQIYKKVRKDWGNVKPFTKVKQSYKQYNRKKEKQNWKKEIEEDF